MIVFSRKFVLEIIEARLDKLESFRQIHNKAKGIEPNTPEYDWYGRHWVEAWNSIKRSILTNTTEEQKLIVLSFKEASELNIKINDPSRYGIDLVNFMQGEKRSFEEKEKDTKILEEILPI